MNIPKNIEAEKSVIGSLLLDSESVYKIIDVVTAEDFYNQDNKNIFESYIKIFNNGGKPDVLTVNSNLKTDSKEYLKSLVGNTPTSANIVSYAKLVKDASLRRQLLQAQDKNQSDIFDDGLEINSVISKTQARIFDVNPLKIKSDKIEDIVTEMEKLQAEYAEKYKNGKKLVGYSTGIDKVDNMIDGVRAGHLWVIGGWHGTGKTSFALNIIHSLLEQGVPTSIISLEMSQIDLTAKLIGIRHELSSMKIMKGICDDRTRNNINEGKEFLKYNNLEIHTEFDLEKIKMQIRKDVYLRGAKVILVDYLQKIMSEKVWDETPRMSKASIELANLAQELKITILLVSQISNEAKKGAGAGAGYKGSGTIEAVADFAVVLKRDKEKESLEAKTVPIDIHITKNKFGFDGTIKYFFQLRSGKFMETDEDIRDIQKQFS